MRDYYVMSIETGRNILDTTRGLASFLFHQLDDINDDDKLIPESKYINKEAQTIYLSTVNFRKFNFSIRSIIDMYIVSNEMLDLIDEFGIKIKNRYSLIVVNSKKSNELLVGRYFLVKFQEDNFYDVLNLKTSIFEQEYPDTIDDVTRLELRNDILIDFIIISELRMNLKTPICSGEFKDQYELLKLKGVSFFAINTAPWLSGTRMEIEHIKDETGESKPFVNPL